MNLFYDLKYINDLGDSIRFGGDDLKIIELEGFGEVDADVQTQRSPYQDGSSVVDVTLEERFIYINFVIRGQNSSELTAMRRKLGRVFNPKIKGRLIITHDGVERVIECYPEHVPAYPDGGTDAVGRVQTASVDLICPNPYWQSTQITEEPAFEPRFRFPFSGPFVMGVQRTDRIIYNDGDAPAPVQITFYGPAQSPYIGNKTTGEYLRINKRLEEGQVLKINTADQSVFFIDEDGTETDVFNWIDLSSTFFHLEVGENDITCNCAISNNQKDFDINYSKLYNAV